MSAATEHRDAGAEYADLRAALRDFLLEQAPVERTLADLELPGGYDPALWQRACAELGLCEVGIPESYGGVGVDLVAELVVAEELGRTVFPGPHLARTLAVTWLLAGGTAEARDLILPGLTVGTEVPGFALGTAPAASAERTHDGWVLSGAAVPVLRGTSDLTLVRARTAEDERLFAVSVGGLLPEPGRVPLDQTRALDLHIVSALPGTDLTGALDADTTASAAARTALLLAAEQLGGAAVLTQLTVDHARTRRQFGRTIGSFQAIKHRLVDTFLEVEATRAWCLALAATDHVTEDPGLRTRVHAVAALASAAYLEAARTAVQVHGGVGFTWEHPAHVYLKRAKATSLLLGSGADHLSRVAAGLAEVETAR